MNRPSVITFGGRFASPEIEGKFRRESLAENLKIARFLGLVVVFAPLIFLLNDWWLLVGTPVYVSLIGARVVTLSLTAGLLLRFRHAITPDVFDRWLLAWTTMALFLTLYIYSTRPPYRMNQALSALIIVSVSMLVPMRFSFQAWTATSFALGAMGLFISKMPDGFMLLENLTALTLAVVVGLFASGRLHRTRRESFAARLVERETIGKLEAALAEVNRLQGILSICASCKKIRQEDGEWKILEMYISERSDASFSHGICPECRTKLYPDCSSRPKDS